MLFPRRTLDTIRSWCTEQTARRNWFAPAAAAWRRKHRRQASRRQGAGAVTIPSLSFSRLCTSCTARQRLTDICTTTPSLHRKRSPPRARRGRRCKPGAFPWTRERGAAVSSSARRSRPRTRHKLLPWNGESGERVRRTVVRRARSAPRRLTGRCRRVFPFVNMYILVLPQIQSAFNLS